MPKKVRAEITAGMRMSIDIKTKNDSTGMRNMLTLSSIVEELLEDENILIHMPIYQGYHYPMPKNEDILMKFWFGSEMYALRARFEERIIQESLSFAKVRIISGISPHQQRDCYRIPCSLPVTVERQRQDEEDLYPESQSVDGRMINFSDGGILFSINENIERDEKLNITFDIGKIESIEGVVVRAERNEDEKYLFKVAAQFRNIDNIQKQRFYKYILDKQMEERRRWN